MSSRWYRLDDLLGLSRAGLLNGAASVVIGGIVGWAISGLFASPTKTELWAVLSVSIVALVVCIAVSSFLAAFQAEGRDRLNVMEASIERLSTSVTAAIEASAVLVPRESIYYEMARCIREAQSQVVVLTYFMFDWDRDERIFHPTMEGAAPPGVDDFYEAIYSCIRHPDVEYLRLWQVPAERLADARDKICCEDRLRREIELVEEVGRVHPDRCRVKIIPESTTASIIVVDRETMFFNIDFRDLENGYWLSPFMLMVRDARGRAFTDMRRVIASLSG